MPRARQVGITGHSIAPALFLSIGSSGKFNHTVGVRSAGTIIAINTDPEAQVFEWADVGIVSNGSAYPRGDLLNGLFRPERIYVVEPPG